MPNGTVGNAIEERSSASVADEAISSRGGSQKAMAASPQSEGEVIASLWALYLAHEFKTSLMSGRYQQPYAFRFREHAKPFDRVALNKFIHIAEKLYKDNILSSEQYYGAIVAATSVYAEQFMSVKLDSYLGKVSRYLSRAFRGVPF